VRPCYDPKAGVSTTRTKDATVPTELITMVLRVHRESRFASSTTARCTRERVRASKNGNRFAEDHAQQIQLLIRSNHDRDQEIRHFSTSKEMIKSFLWTSIAALSKWKAGPFGRRLSIIAGASKRTIPSHGLSPKNKLARMR
jgi:hypothetical protein